MTWITQKNIKRYEDLLATEEDSARREVVLALLQRERERLRAILKKDTKSDPLDTEGQFLPK